MMTFYLLRIVSKEKIINGLDGVKEILMQRVEFFGRQTRGAIDPVNSLLNYGYGILYSTVWGALVNAGLEPFAGFLHVDRPGKPSLVLDLIEEFRQPVVDRVVIAHVNLGQDIKITDGLLDADTRKIIGEKVLGRLESIETYKGKKYQIHSIIQMQARNLASFLRGQQDYNFSLSSGNPSSPPLKLRGGRVGLK
ncbi:MAG: CRISPR-associated endonuclease Cas1 [Nitrospirota bacterium]